MTTVNKTAYTQKLLRPYDDIIAQSGATLQKTLFQHTEHT